jgi:signal transduction histidine kinase
MYLNQNEIRDDISRDSAEIQVLRRVSLEMNSTLNLEEIFDIVLRTMDELFGFRHSIILLLDESGETLTVVASRGYEGKELGAMVKVGTGVIGMVAKKRQLIRLSNLSQQRAYASTIRRQMEKAGRTRELYEIVQIPGLADVESQIAIPLMIKDQLIGVFSVESREQKTFGEREEMFIAIVANHAASAIQNAQLFESEENRRKELAEAHEQLKELNETLEIRVKVRTEELERTNRELKETQSQLVQSGKMVSLGLLAAGIAHEINNPIGVIHSNADLASRAIEIVRDSFEDTDLNEVLKDKERMTRAVEIMEETNKVTLDATDRVVKIVRSLKSFARLDRAELESVNLVEGIDSSLTLLQHIIKDRIKVVKNYNELPNVRCYASQINQVFMNILTNAVQAIEESGTITITTYPNGENVVVEVEDTGIGIAPDDLKHVFDPGFTTKGVGVGTGLGLSIAFRIVEGHNGSLDVESEPGKGTKFTLRLPVSQSK